MLSFILIMPLAVRQYIKLKILIFHYSCEIQLWMVNVLADWGIKWSTSETKECWYGQIHCTCRSTCLLCKAASFGIWRGTAKRITHLIHKFDYYVKQLNHLLFVFHYFFRILCFHISGKNWRHQDFLMKLNVF